MLERTMSTEKLLTRRRREVASLEVLDSFAEWTFKSARERHNRVIARIDAELERRL